MKKLLVILTFAVLTISSALAQDSKDKIKKVTKMDAFTSKTGVMIKYIDYEFPKIKLSGYLKAENKVRKIICGQEVEYFYQIIRKGEYDTAIGSIAYQDLIEVIKAIQSLKIDSESDKTLNPDYLENKFVTDDGFEVGYYVNKSEVKWYVILEKYGSENLITFRNVTELESAFSGAKQKIDTLKTL